MTSLALLFTLFGPYSKDISNFDSEELEYYMDLEVNQCLLKMYFIIIEFLKKGLTEDQILEEINNINFEEYEKLDLKRKEYVQKDTKKLLLLRKQIKKERKDENE